MSKTKVILAAVLTMLALAQPSQAGPKRWLKNHKELVGALAAVAVGSTIEEKGVTRCQQGYLEACNVGYGSRRGFAGFMIGGSLAMVAAGEACKKDQPGWWFCHGLEFATPAAQTAMGFKDFASFKPCDKGETACGVNASKLVWKKK